MFLNRCIDRKKSDIMSNSMAVNQQMSEKIQSIE